MGSSPEGCLARFRRLAPVSLAQWFLTALPIAYILVVMSGMRPLIRHGGLLTAGAVQFVAMLLKSLVCISFAAGLKRAGSLYEDHGFADAVALWVEVVMQLATRLIVSANKSVVRVLTSSLMASMWELVGVGFSLWWLTWLIDEAEGECQTISRMGNDECVMCSDRRERAGKRIEELRKDVSMKVVAVVADVRGEYIATMLASIAIPLFSDSASVTGFRGSFGWADIPMLLFVQFLPEVVFVDPIVFMLLRRSGLDLSYYQECFTRRWHVHRLAMLTLVGVCIPSAILFALARSDLYGASKLLDGVRSAI
jgi:hypothetical protein